MKPEESSRCLSGRLPGDLGGRGRTPGGRPRGFSRTDECGEDDHGPGWNPRCDASAAPERAVIATVAAARLRPTNGEASDPRFAVTIDAQIAGQTARLVLTGTAVRTKYMLSVYTIGSYLEEGVKVRDAVELDSDRRAQAIAPDLRAQRRRGNHCRLTPRSDRHEPSRPGLHRRAARLDQYFRAYSAGPGDHVWLTYIPGAGLTCRFADHPALFIENVAFAEAAWEVYLGRKNLGAAIKAGLTSRL